MPITIIQPRQVTEVIRYYLTFHVENQGVHSFSCDHNGVVQTDTLSESNRHYYEACKSGKLSLKVPPYIRERIQSVTFDAVAICECGEQFVMFPDELGVCQCSCGNEYNLCGQKLRPRSQWEERIDDDY